MFSLNPGHRQLTAGLTQARLTGSVILELVWTACQGQAMGSSCQDWLLYEPNCHHALYEGLSVQGTAQTLPRQITGHSTASAQVPGCHRQCSSACCTPQPLPRPHNLADAMSTSALPHLHELCPLTAYGLVATIQ